jgi:uncharacterized membrane protein
MKHRLVSFLASFALMGCGGGSSSTESADLPSVDCSANPAPTFTEMQAGAFGKCEQCHSSSKTGADRHDAPAGVNFDQYDSAKAWSMEAATFVHDGVMPPNDPTVRVTLSDAEKQAIYAWAQCGTPQ